MVARLVMLRNNSSASKSSSEINYLSGILQQLAGLLSSELALTNNINDRNNLNIDSFRQCKGLKRLAVS